RPTAGQPTAAAQGFSVAMEFGDGSLATVLYQAGGATGLSKERIEAHADGWSIVIDDFRGMTVYEGRRGRRGRGAAGKGHAQQFEHLAAITRGQSSPLAPDPLDTMGVTLAALESATTGAVVARSE